MLKLVENTGTRELTCVVKATEYFLLGAGHDTQPILASGGRMRVFTSIPRCTCRETNFLEHVVS